MPKQVEPRRNLGGANFAKNNLEQTPLNRSQQQQQHRTNDLLAESSKTNYEIMTGQLTI